MLEYIGYKKFKKYKSDKEEKERADKEKHEGKQPEKITTAVSHPAPVLDPEDEDFLHRLLSDAEAEEGPAPPLPPRVKTPEFNWESDESRRSTENSKGTKTETKKDDKTSKITNRISLLFAKKDKNPNNQLTVPNSDVTLSEAEREKRDMNKVLDDLNLSAKNNKAFCLSTESNELVRKFTVVLKDLVNGVPTAVDDLTGLLEDRDGVLKNNFEKLPGSMKKFVTQMPSKLSASLAPELLAVAAESQGIKASEESGGVKGAAKKMFMPRNLQDLVTKPGAVVGMLRAIVNALKLRWPAFIGTNIVWSIALFLLLFVLWYCHKRGREVRLEQEKLQGNVAEGDRIEELPDDPALPAPEGSGSQSRSGNVSSRTQLPPPPIGEHSRASTQK